jgi:hypothetical protein
MDKNDNATDQRTPMPANSTPPQDDMSDEFNTVHPVGSDARIDPDLNLQGYQEDLNTGNKNDVLQNQHHNSPVDVTGMPPKEMKRELDQLAGDDLGRMPDDNEDSELGTAEDRREHIEDMDEGDKDR